MSRNDSTSKCWMAVGLLAVALLWAYSNSFGVPFLLDDKRSIPDNPHVRQILPLSAAMGAPPQSGVAGRPILALCLALNYAACGLDVRGYHLANLLIHIACAVVLFLVVRRCLLIAGRGAMPPSAAVWLALATAGLWAVHPIQTMCVTYIIQRAESLMTLFLLLTVYSALRAADSTRTWAWNLLAIGACLLCAGCKEVAVVIPALVFALDRVLLFDSLRAQVRSRRWLYAGLACSWILLALLNGSGPRSESAGWSLATISPWDYLRTQPEVLLHYVRLAVWPSGLCLDYDWPIARDPARIAACGSVVLAAFAVSVWGIIQRKSGALLPAVFFIVLSPTSSIVPIIVPASEHRMYLPLAMICLAVVLVAWQIVRKGAARACAMGVVVALLAGLTHERNGTYQSSVTMWRDVVAQRPKNIRGWNNLGNELHRAGDNAAAVEAYQAALTLDPARFDVLYNLGVAQLEIQRLEEAVDSFHAAARLRPTDGNIRSILGHSLRRVGRPAEALPHLQQALALLPGYPRANAELGLTLIALGRTGDAVLPLRESLSGNGASVEAALALAWIRATDADARNRHAAESLRWAEWAVQQTQGGSAVALDALAAALAEAGRFSEAAAVAEKALALCHEKSDAVLIARIRLRLGFYQAGRAYHSGGEKNAKLQ